ncbi:Zn-ribbon domain-containing OB-fold protein [Cryptosporangium sp. NPDC051539]|uniref:Zn-ribbon domain-containing OB-fold protein n=1 Tax=Cryptosporangium sp. NPDC051539 TaxID=3363962 RepID=UPI0037A6E8AE
MTSDAEVAYRLPDVVLDADTVGYYRGWLERHLLLNRCAECSTWHHPPKPVCPECWSSRVEPTEVSGQGTIHLLVWLRQGPPVDGVTYPHPVATIELDDQPGLRYTSTLVGARRGRTAIGNRVRLVWIERAGEPFPAFEVVR